MSILPCATFYPNIFFGEMSTQVFCLFSEMESFSPILLSCESPLVLISVYIANDRTDSFIRYVLASMFSQILVFLLPLKWKSKRVLF